MNAPSIRPTGFATTTTSITTTGPDVERAAEAEIRTATAAFDPRFYSWTQGQAPTRYVTQLRNVTLALLDRIEANRNGERSPAIAALQDANLTLLSRAYGQLKTLRYPQAPGDEFIGQRKVPHWEGSVWKDTYNDYRRYHYNTSATSQFSTLDQWVDAARRYTRDGSYYEAISYVRGAATAFADGVASVYASGFPLYTSTYSRRVGGWNH